MRNDRLTRVWFVAAVAIALGGWQLSRGDNQTAPTADGGGDTQRAVGAMLDQYKEAMMKGDAAALDRIWADDLTFVNLRGELLTKRQRMENVKTGATAFKSIKLSAMLIRPCGEGAAVATFRAALEGQYSGQEGTGDYRVTTVWSRTKGDWQMVAVQMTRVAR